MPTFYNRLSETQLQQFLTDHRTLTDSMIAELHKAKVDLNGFTSEQINHYKQALGIDTGEQTAPTNPGKNPANPQNPRNPASFTTPATAPFNQPGADRVLPEAQVKDGPRSPPHREPFAPSGSHKK